MKLSPSNVFLRVLNLLAFGLMLAVNILSSLRPFGGKSLENLSQTYPSLFLPAGYVFSIWWLIYSLLFGFILFQFLDLFFKRHEKIILEFVDQKSGWFIVSCLLNASWLLAWQTERIGLSLLIMTTLFITLACLYAGLDQYRSGQHPLRFQLFFLVPFRVYFAWISVALFVNAAALLASIGIWQSLSAQIALSCGFFLILGSILFYMLQMFEDWAFLMVWVWAIIGILIARITTDPAETILVIIFGFLVLIELAFLVGKKIKWRE